MDGKYNYRGIYDEGETGRINTLLAEQRNIFLNQEKSASNNERKVIKYTVAILGILGILLAVKFVTKK